MHLIYAYAFLILNSHVHSSLKLFKTLIYSNIYIALAAVLLCFETQIQLGLKLQWHPYIFILFFATFIEYSLHPIYKSWSNQSNAESLRDQWVKMQLKPFIAVNLIALVLLFFVSIQAKLRVIFMFIPIAIITILYSVPWAKKGKKFFRLRDIPYLKIFLIALIWSSTTVLIPFIHSEIRIDNIHVFFLTLERFIFILAITIPFDVRDMEADLAAGIKTLPALISVSKANKMAIVFIMFFAILNYINYIWQNNLFLLIFIQISAAFTYFVLTHPKFKKSEYYYYGWLDGTMIIQGLLVIMGYFFGGIR